MIRNDLRYTMHPHTEPVDPRVRAMAQSNPHPSVAHLVIRRSPLTWNTVLCTNGAIHEDVIVVTSDSCGSVLGCVLATMYFVCAHTEQLSKLTLCWKFSLSDNSKPFTILKRDFSAVSDHPQLEVFKASALKLKLQVP